MFERILCAYDGSDHAKAAVRSASRIAKTFGGSLYLCHTPHVSNPTIVVGGFVSQVESPLSDEEIAAAARSVIAQAEEIAREEGVDILGVSTAPGDPAEAILDFAEVSDADLIVMGRRGLSALGSLAIGSVSLKVAHGAKCACMTVV